LFSAKITALVKPSSSIALGALTLIVTPALLAATVPATLNPEGMALPLGTRVEGVLTADDDGTLGVVDGLGAGGRLGLGAVAIFGSDELLGVLGAENEGLEIVATLGRSGTAL
jgi:hypothetical protein